MTWLLTTGLAAVALIVALTDWLAKQEARDAELARRRRAWRAEQG